MGTVHFFYLQFSFLLLVSSIKGKSTVFLKRNNENKKAFNNKKNWDKKESVCVCVCVRACVRTKQIQPDIKMASVTHMSGLLNDWDFKCKVVSKSTQDGYWARELILSA